jgi:hypothetical protein
MEIKEFMLAVREELDTIKERATKEEISKLDFTTFNKQLEKFCIYGQMTGFCSSGRAKEIMEKTFYRISAHWPIHELTLGVFPLYTHLEYYLLHADRKTEKEIIQYLKGEISEIELPIYETMKGGDDE